MGDGLADGPAIYLWFQFRLLVVADTIWSSGGRNAFRAFRDTLRMPYLSDDLVLEAIGAINPTAEHVLRNWPADPGQR